MTALTSGDQAVLVMACRKLREMQYVMTDVAATAGRGSVGGLCSGASDTLREQLNAVESVLRSNGIMP